MEGGVEVREWEGVAYVADWGGDVVCGNQGGLIPGKVYRRGVEGKKISYAKRVFPAESNSATSNITV